MEPTAPDLVGSVDKPSLLGRKRLPSRKGLQERSHAGPSRALSREEEIPAQPTTDAHHGGSTLQMHCMREELLAQLLEELIR